MKDFLLRASQFAISAHNCQPFRFQFSDDQITVFVSEQSHLPAADPTEKDLRASLGALFEAWDISLNSQGKCLRLVKEPPMHAIANQAYSVFKISNST